jgi:hypothetical protein
MINLGEGPKVVLAQTRESGQRSYQAGQQVGEFKLVAIEQSGLIFEWEGKRIPATYAEIRDTKPPVQTQTTASQTTSAQAPKPATAAVSIGTTTTTGPGADYGGDVRPCVAGDASPAGTVSGGYKKVLANSPFGKSCFWEKVK